MLTCDSSRAGKRSSSMHRQVNAFSAMRVLPPSLHCSASCSPLATTYLRITPHTGVYLQQMHVRQWPPLSKLVEGV